MYLIAQNISFKDLSLFEIAVLQKFQSQLIQTKLFLSLTVSEIAWIIFQLKGENRMEVQYQQISPKAMKVRNLNELITSLISLVVITGLYFCTDYFNWWNWLRYVWIALFIITIIGIPWTYFVSSPIYYKTFRYGLTDDFLYIKSGVLTKVEVVVPMTKIQSIELIQGIIMRKYGVRSIEIKTMQGGVTIPHIEEEVAIKLRDDISKLARLKELDER